LKTDFGNQNMKQIIKLLLIIGLLNPSVIFGFFGDDSKIYNKGKKYVIERKIEEAINVFEQLINKYPDSRYVDDSYFWIGYCFEMIGNKEIEAFMAYQRLVNLFPNSSWMDDARIHQISLVEQFISEGNGFYQNFLIEMIENDDKNIKYQSALSLGKLKHPRAKPVLEEMVNDKDEEIRFLAVSLIEEMNQSESEPRGADIEIELSKKAGRERMINKENASDMQEKQFNLPFFGSERYEQYMLLRKKGDDWTSEELAVSGLWHITSPDEFKELALLNTHYDRKEWMRKYWKRRDPTPTTEVNELKDEFERRVEYARKNYSKPWDYRRMSHLKEQYIRTGWSWAPWDSRGEIFIKYGEPSSTYPLSFNVEEWTYFQYNVDFEIHKYMTNIFGNAIKPGRMSKQIHNSSPYYVETYFVYHPEIRYNYDYEGADEIKDVRISLNHGNKSESGWLVNVDYQIPRKEIKFISDSGVYKGKIKRRYVIYDEDLKLIQVKEATVSIGPYSKSEYKNMKYIEGGFSFSIQVGVYQIALRIEDQFSNRLGIYLQEFNVVEKPVLLAR